MHPRSSTLLATALLAPLPAAPASAEEPIAWPALPAWTMSVDSEILDERRTLSLVLPASYARTSRPYPVAYVLDGEGPAFLVTAAAARFLAQQGLAPEMIVVGIHNTQRERDMTPTGLDLPQFEHLEKGADDFLECLDRELMAAVEARYRAKPMHLLIGHSHGGILGTYALAARPDLFRWHLAIDAPLSLRDGWLLTNLAAFLTEERDHRGRLVSIARETSPSPSWRALRESAPAGFVAERVVISGETHESVLYRGVYEGLRRLFHDYPIEERDGRTLSQVAQTHEPLEAAWGGDVAPSLRAFVLQAQNQTMMGRGEEALELLGEATRLYGEFAGAAELRSQASTLARSGAPVESVEDLEALPKASAEEMGPYLGEWEETSPGSPRNRVTFSVRDGQVVGVTRLAAPDGSLGLRIPHSVIEVPGENRLAFGYRNNRRPRGVLYYD